MKIKDNEYREKEDFESISELVSRIQNKTLGELEKEGIFVFPTVIKDSEDLEQEQIILKSINDKYLSSNVMGYLGLGKQRLIIESRFSKNENDYLFWYLIERVLKLKNVTDMEIGTNSDNRILDILLCLFPKYLKSATRKGIYKTYVNNQYNDKNVGGTINIARHIKKNTPFVGNIAYSKREYSYDNYLTELIRHTIEYIKGKEIGKVILESVKNEIKSIISVTPKYKLNDRHRIIEENSKNKITHSYYNEYLSLQQLCLWILKEEKQQYGKETNNIYGILFDGAWLFEEYINTIIEEEFYHPKNKKREGGQYLFDNFTGLIYPDFIGKDAKKRKIADAKYKPAGNIYGKDYLQLLAYMFRFDSKCGYYIYPEAENRNDKVLNLTSGTTYEETKSNEEKYKNTANDEKMEYNTVAKNEIEKVNDEMNKQLNKEITVIKCGLQIPNNVENYAEFVRQMKESETDLISKIMQ